MINWAEIDKDFLAVAKDYQERYDGKGSFLQPGEVADANRITSYENVYAKFEVTVSLGEASSPDGGVPVRFEVKSGDQTKWADGWLPSCAIVESEEFTESERALMSAYLKSNALGMIQSILNQQGEGKQ